MAEKGEIAQSRDMAAGAGMRHEAQRQAAEAGEWWVQAESRRTEVRSGRGGGEQAQEIGYMANNNTDGGCGRI